MAKKYAVTEVYVKQYQVEVTEDDVRRTVQTFNGESGKAVLNHAGAWENAAFVVADGSPDGSKGGLQFSNWHVLEV